MDSPAIVEDRFRALLHELGAPGSACQKSLRIREFLLPCLDGGRFLDPYLPEAVENLVQLLPRANFVGIDPRWVRDLIRIIDEAQVRRPEIANLSGLPQTLTALREAAALQYAFVGEPTKAIDFLAERSSGTADGSASLESPAEPLLDRYRRGQYPAGSYSAPDLHQWGTLLNRWQRLVNTARNGGVIPVVEQNLGGAIGGWSGLRTVFFESFDYSGDGSDHIQANVAVTGVHGAPDSTFSPALAAGRTCFRNHTGQKRTLHLSCRIEFEGVQKMHTGESANLTLASLAYCHLTRLAQMRERFRIEQAVAMTGGIDPQGNVLPVDSGSFEAKVRGTFFSWITTLAVPLEQLEAARLAVMRLQETYPNRTLNLIGVKHLQEVFFDRRLTRLVRLNPATFVAHKLWARRRPLAIATILVLLAVIARLWYGPLDKEPAGWVVEDESLVVRNASGSILDRIAVGRLTSTQALTDTSDDPGRQIAALADVDGNGKREIVWGSAHDSVPDGPSVVYCKGVGEELPRWSFLLTRKLQLSRRTGFDDQAFRWYRVEAGDYDGDGRVEIYVLALHEGFPCLLLKLDGETGRELGTYIHSGHIKDMKAIDLNGDGIREILLSGVNNSLRSACLIVVKPSMIDGYSPHAPIDDLDSVHAANELAYVLIPRTIVGEMFRKQVRYNIADGIRIHGLERTFSLVVRDAFVGGPQKADRLSSTVFPVFDFNLNLVTMRTGDDFDTLYDYFQERGQIKRQPSYSYISDYVRSFRARPWIKGSGFTR